MLLSAWVSSANATLIFDFTFTDKKFVVIGEILGLSNDSKGAATTINIISNTAGFGVGLYTPIIISPAGDVNNLFTVNTLGQIVDANFSGSLGSNKFYIGKTNRLDDGKRFALVITGNISISQRVTVPEVSVPEPGTVILLSLGLTGLSFARYRRQS
jgi:hypothetical protein